MQFQTFWKKSKGGGSYLKPFRKIERNIGIPPPKKKKELDASRRNQEGVSYNCPDSQILIVKNFKHVFSPRKKPRKRIFPKFMPKQLFFSPK